MSWPVVTIAAAPGSGQRSTCRFFLEELGPFGTTRGAVQKALRLHRELPISDHLESETYTWDVLPADLKGAG